MRRTTPSWLAVQPVSSIAGFGMRGAQAARRRRGAALDA